MLCPRPIPHFRQSDISRNCGAACLVMIYQFYKRKGKLREVTSRVSELENGQPVCKNSLMLQDALNNGFAGMIVSAKDIKSFITFCLSQGIEMIISYHPTANDPQGHSSVVNYADEHNVYINDPALDRDEGFCRAISYDDLEILMKATTASGEIRVSNTVFLLAPHSGGLKIGHIAHNMSSFHVPVIDCVMDKIEYFVDPSIDTWMYYRPAQV